MGKSSGYYSYSGSISSCHATGSVSGGASVGGLVGSNGSSVTGCNATGTVSGTGDDVGGLVGYNWGDGTKTSLTFCYSTGSVIGTGYSVGGLVGYNNGGTLTSCYANGSVSEGTHVGGMVGENYDGKLTGCYATGTVSGTGYVGGLVGLNYEGTLTGCFWDINTSSQTVGVGYGTSTGVTGKTTAEMKTLSTFTYPPASWDFRDTDGDPADWMMLREGEDYPRLAWQEIFAGDIADLYGVNFVDYAEMAAHWGQTGCPTGCENADINSDGTVDIDDLTLLAYNWLEGI